MTRPTNQDKLERSTAEILGAFGGAALGAALGALTGPAGSVIGGAVGATTGLVAADALASSTPPENAVDDEYWSQAFNERPYVHGEPYSHWKPAYDFGRFARCRTWGFDWDEVLPDVRTAWQRREGAMPWDEAEPAIYDGWTRLEDRLDFWLRKDEWERHHDEVLHRPDSEFEAAKAAYLLGVSARLISDADEWSEVAPVLEDTWKGVDLADGFDWSLAEPAARHAWEWSGTRLPECP